MAGDALHGAVGLRGRAAALAFCVSFGVERGADCGLLRRDKFPATTGKLTRKLTSRPPMAEAAETTINEDQGKLLSR